MCEAPEDFFDAEDLGDKIKRLLKREREVEQKEAKLQEYRKRLRAVEADVRALKRKVGDWEREEDERRWKEQRAKMQRERKDDIEREVRERLKIEKKVRLEEDSREKKR